MFDPQIVVEADTRDTSTSTTRMDITGHTKVCFMVADPIGQVRSPDAFNARYRHAEGLDAVMVPMHVEPSGFKSFWSGMRSMENLAGCVVSVPHKATAYALSDAAGRNAREMGAANVVRREAGGRMTCDNFDGAGFMSGLEKNGFSVEGKRVLLAGAGGAGSALALSFAAAGVGALAVHDIDPKRYASLKGRVIEHYPQCAISEGTRDPTGFDMIVNATPCGMRMADPLPIDANRLAPDTVVADIIMKPEVTALLRAALDRGCAVHYGHHMMDGQLDTLARFMGFCE